MYLSQVSRTTRFMDPSILSLNRGVYELWATATNYFDLHTTTRANEALWKPFENASFRFEVTATGHTIPSSRKKKIVDDFAYMNYLGPIDLKNAEVVLAYFEECARYPF